MNEWPPSDKIGNLPSEKISSNVSFSNLNDHLTSLITFEFDENYIQDAGAALINLLKYPFSSKEYNGKKDSRFNDVERVDIFRDETLRTVRCPVRFHNVLKYMETMKGRKPGIGLKYKKGTHHNQLPGKMLSNMLSPSSSNMKQNPHLAMTSSIHTEVTSKGDLRGSMQQI